MAGATQVELTSPNPTTGTDDEWLSDKAWASILELSGKFPMYENFDKDFSDKYLNEWKEIYNSAKPQCIKHQPWPGKWNDLTIFNRLLIMRILRPDKVIPLIEKLIVKEKEMGKAYIESPPFSMGEILKDSTNKTPIIIVLSPGADPMSEIMELAREKNTRLESLSLGKGQDKKAKDQIMLS